MESAGKKHQVATNSKVPNQVTWCRAKFDHRIDDESISPQELESPTLLEVEELLSIRH